MRKADLNDYEDLYSKSMRLDDASLIELKMAFEDGKSVVTLRFSLEGQYAAGYSSLFVKCVDFDFMQSSGKGLYSFVSMCGYPNSLHVQVENGLHAFYLVPNEEIIGEAPLEAYGMKITCKELYYEFQRGSLQ